MFGIEKRIKSLILDLLSDGDIKKEVDRYIKEATIRALREAANDLEKSMKR